MKKPEIPKNENERLAALESYQVLDTPPEVEYDDITKLASTICDTPIALISLIDSKRQWFKSHHGIDATETERELAFCAHAIHESKPFVIEDALKDDRFKDNPLVTGQPLVHFYAGAQLKTPSGHNIGTLCVVDHKPRKLNAAQIEALDALARHVCQLLEMRKMAFFSKQREKILESTIANQKKTEEEAVAKAEQLRTLFDAMSEGVALQDSEARIIQFNKSSLVALGLTEDQMLGKTSFDPNWRAVLSDGSDFPGEKHPAIVALRTGKKVKDFLMGVHRPDGQLRWLSVSATPIFKDGEAKPVQVLVTFSDITERREVEMKLATNEKLLSSVLETLPVVVFGKNIKKNFQWSLWNREAENLFGLKAEECLGKFDSDYFPKEQADFFRKKDIEASSSNEIIDIPEEPANTAKGPVTLHTRKIVVRDEKGEPSILVGVSEDITKRKAAEKMIQDQQMKLVASAKMSALGEMAGGVAHEINNPLAIILAKVGQLKKRMSDGSADVAKTLDDLAKIETTGERIEKIIKGLRTFSRNAENDPMQKIAVESLVQDALALCNERLKNINIELKTNVEKDVFIACRPTQIVQILINLISNAEDAIENIEEKWIDINVRSHDGFAEISVTDSGKGIPAGIVEKIMQPFYTTKEVGKGTGLGLSISKGIAEDHKGELNYDPGSKNTRFVLQIPLVEN